MIKWILLFRGNIEFSVVVSMCEIYKERINDLLDRTKIDLEIREDKVHGAYVP